MATFGKMHIFTIIYYLSPRILVRLHQCSDCLFSQNFLRKVKIPPWPRCDRLDLVGPGGGGSELLPGGVGGGVVRGGGGEQRGRGEVLKR